MSDSRLQSPEAGATRYGGLFADNIMIDRRPAALDDICNRLGLPGDERPSRGRMKPCRRATRLLEERKSKDQGK